MISAACSTILPRELVDPSSICIPKGQKVVINQAFKPHDASSINVDPRDCDCEPDSPDFSSGNKLDTPFNLDRSVSVYTSTTVIIATTLVTAPSRTINTTSTFTSNTSITQSKQTTNESSSTVHTSAIVGAIIGTLGTMMIAVLGIFYIQKRVRRSTKLRTDTLESPTESQPPPPVLPKPIPVKIAREPYTLKYQEAQGIAKSSLEPEQNGFIHPSIRIFTPDGRRIDELMERMHTLETRLAMERVYGGQASTPLPPYYTDDIPV
ncbi:hypothetical protein F5050DRAFT_1785948 [Lentinula boryana]|uniref:Uncharacterized protein n=1 Tax=Lentinula boryana TaxID=40481 RepID=A0ABQ8Q222_9AGAR|nr:hypothetical protein F5050DRAFT_1785948 [Lentinula boryana]